MELTIGPDGKKFWKFALHNVLDLLCEKGTFPPHACGLTHEGEFEYVVGLFENELSDDQTMERIESGLRKGIRQNRYKAVGVFTCWNASVIKRSGVGDISYIKMFLEHCDGVAQEIKVHYHWDGPDKNVKFGGVKIREEQSKFFRD